MSTNFPTGTDSYATLVDNVDAIAAADINDPRDAIEAIEAKVGVNSSAVTSSIDYKLINHSHQAGSQGALINLTSAVTGTLPEANGGTGVTDIKINASGYAVYA